MIRVDLGEVVAAGCVRFQAAGKSGRSTGRQSQQQGSAPAGGKALQFQCVAMRNLGDPGAIPICEEGRRFLRRRATGGRKPAR
jgi:hypothetical protein